MTGTGLRQAACSLVRRAARRAGFRGGFLAIFGVFDLFYGLYLALGAPVEHDLLFGERIWGYAWMAVGVFLLTAPLSRDGRWQFSAAAGLKMAWAMEYLRLAIFEQVPYNWIRTCYWSALALLILLVSFWPEPRYERK